MNRQDPRPRSASSRIPRQLISDAAGGSWPQPPLMGFPWVEAEDMPDIAGLALVVWALWRFPAAASGGRETACPFWRSLSAAPCAVYPPSVSARGAFRAIKAC